MKGVILQGEHKNTGLTPVTISCCKVAQFIFQNSSVKLYDLFSLCNETWIPVISSYLFFIYLAGIAHVNGPKI